MIKIADAIKNAREKAKKRNFTQSIDLIITLRNMDMKKPENNFSDEVLLPHGSGKNTKVGVIGKDLSLKAKDIADEVLNETKLSELEKNNKKAKAWAENLEYIIAEPQLMARIGKSMGKILGPRGKMPKPLPAQADPKLLINKLKKTTKVKLKNTPVIQCLVGSEELDDKQVEENIKIILNHVESKLPNGKQNIKEVYIKLTMGPSIKIGEESGK